MLQHDNRLLHTLDVVVTRRYNTTLITNFVTHDIVVTDIRYKL